MKLKFLSNLILSFTRSFNHHGSRISYITLYEEGGRSSLFISCLCFRAWFQRRVSDFQYIWETKTCDRPFQFSCMRADLTFSENSHLTIFTTKFGGDSFDDAPLLCTPCTLSMFFKISSLVVSGKTLDIWSISTYLVSDQELSSAWWILMFLNIKVFLRDLLFSSSISLSNSLIVSNWFSHFILSFQTLNSISSLLLLALALASSAFFSICSIFMYIYLAVVSNFSSIEISFWLKSSNFSLSSTLIDSWSTADLLAVVSDRIAIW